MSGKQVTNWLKVAPVVACVVVVATAAVTGAPDTVKAQQTKETPAPEPSVRSSAGAVIDGQQGVEGRTAAGTAAGPAQQGMPAAPPSGAGVRSVRRETPARPMGATTGGGAFEPIQRMPVPEGSVPNEGEKISISPDEGPLLVTRILDDLVTATGWSVIASKGVEQEQVRVWLRDVSPKQALQALEFHGIHYEFDPGTKFLYVMLKEEYLAQQHGAIEEQAFTIQHADVIDMEAVLTNLLSRSGRLIADPRTAQIFVWDTHANLEVMAETVGRLDKPIEPRTFSLKYLSAEDLLESVQNMLSERGLAHIDARSNALVVTDLPARMDQIGNMIEALDRKLETRTWTLSYADTESVVERLENVIPEEAAVINSDEDKHQVSVTSVQARLDEVDELIAAWDVKGRQVMIEAFLVAAEQNVSRRFGIDWFYFDEISGVPFSLQSGSSRPDYTAAPDEGQRMSVGRLPYRQFLRDPITGARRIWLDDANSNEAAPDPADIEYILDPEFKGNRVGAVLDYLDDTGMLDVLSRPRVTVQDGQEALFENTTDIPYQQGGYSQYQYANDTNPNFNRVIPLQVQFVEVGTVLKVQPRISPRDNIRLVIEAEDSSAEIITVTVGDQDSTVPQKTQNKATTDVLVHNGQTIVIGGLRFTSLDDDVEKVPLLGDIPGIGRLFRTTQKTHEDRELLVFLTTTIVNEFTHPEASRLADAEQNATETMRHSAKSIWGRAVDKLSRGKNEIGVAIGQTGSIHCDGEVVTVEQLERKFEGFDTVPGAKVIIQRHPRAPLELEEAVADAARSAGLKVDIDNTRMPIVPSLPPETEADSPETVRENGP